jgi:hypothetical protein
MSKSSKNEKNGNVRKMKISANQQKKIEEGLIEVFLLIIIIKF